MKIVINACYGGFSLSNDASALLHASRYESSISFRTHPAFIALVENDADWVSGCCARLRVAEVPDEATDWELNEYDGLESITYVLNGKLHHAR